MFWRCDWTGITSACAEKSSIACVCSSMVWNYLRMRGEEWTIDDLFFYGWELPPHARRRGITARYVGKIGGITSACAEKRYDYFYRNYGHWNYLRMRGEETAGRDSSARAWELPPHARRRVGVPSEFKQFHGITSACAEKSNPNRYRTLDRGNYLRMRGEEISTRAPRANREELPPHARRRALALFIVQRVFGITSACAEKSGICHIRARSIRNYLRMRGEETALPAETLAVGVVL